MQSRSLLPRLLQPGRPVVLLLTLLTTALFAGAATPGLSVDKEGVLRLRGKPWRGVGVNYYDLFVRTLLTPPHATYEAGLAELAQRHIPFARFSAGGYWPSEWALYQTNRTEYFTRLDGVVRSAERHGIGLIPSLFWLHSTVPDLVGEPVSRLGDPASRTHAFLQQYTREVVGRYKGSPAIWGWEMGNEYNLPADLPNAAEHRPPVVPSLGTPGSRGPEDDLTHAQMRVAMRAFAEEVRRLDPHRVIVSGNAFPRVSAWHQAAEHSWKHDSAEQFAEVLAADNPSPMNLLSVRGYDPEADFARIPQAMMVSRTQKKPLFIGEFGVAGRTDDAARAKFASMLRSLETNQVPIAALWVFDFDGQADDWSVTRTNGRGWQLDEIQQLNLRLQRDAGRRR